MGVDCKGRTWTGAPLQLSARFHQFISGRVRTDVRTVRIRFADGTATTLTPTRGYVLWAAPKQHLSPQTAAIAVQGLSVKGNVIARIALPPPRK